MLFVMQNTYAYYAYAACDNLAANLIVSFIIIAALKHREREGEREREIDRGGEERQRHLEAKLLELLLFWTKCLGTLESYERLTKAFNLSLA